MQAALAGRPVAAGGAAVATASSSGAETADGAVLEALPVGLIVTDEAGVVRRCTALARAWLSIAGPGTGHPYRPTLAQWPAIAEALASVHAGEVPDAFAVDAPAAPAGTVTVTVARWTPSGARGGAMAVLSLGAAALAAAVDQRDAATGPADDGMADASRLASGLAHELANSLTTVHGYAHMVDRSSLSSTTSPPVPSGC
jgi:hypothetical protein